MLIQTLKEQSSTACPSKTNISIRNNADDFVNTSWPPALEQKPTAEEKGGPSTSLWTRRQQKTHVTAFTLKYRLGSYTGGEWPTLWISWESNTRWAVTLLPIQTTALRHPTGNRTDAVPLLYYLYKRRHYETWHWIEPTLCRYFTNDTNNSIMTPDRESNPRCAVTLLMIQTTALWQLTGDWTHAA